MVTFGIMVAPEMSPQKVLELVKLAEQSNIDNAWIMDEDCMREVYTTLSFIASNTKRIKIGPGVTNPHTRHPAITALAVTTLDEISNGRAILGLGFGGALLTYPFDIKVERITPTVEEYLRIVRRLLNSEKVTYRGSKFNLSNAQLTFKPLHKIPIYIGTRGKFMLRMAGRNADGILLAGAPLQYIPYAIKQIEIGAKKSKRTLGEIDVGNTLALSISNNISEAVELAKPFVTFLAAEAPPIMLEEVGLTDEDVLPIRKAMSKGIFEAAKYVTQEMVDIFSISGSPDLCMEKINKFIKSGINHIVFTSPFGPNIKKTFEILSELTRSLNE